MTKFLIFFLFFLCMTSTTVQAQNDDITFEKMHDEFMQMSDKKNDKALRFKDQFMALFDWPQYKNLKDRLALKAGPSISYRHLKGDFNTEDRFMAYGLSSEFAFSFTPHWHVTLMGQVLLGKTKQLDFDLNGQHLRSEGSYRSFTISPAIKYVFQKPLKPAWYWYAVMGPAWSMQSMKIDTFNDTEGKRRENHKFSHESIGGLLGIGVQEMLPYKTMHPTHVELTFQHIRGSKATLVDASDFTEVERVSYDDREKNINGNIVVLTIGITLF